MKNNNYDTGLKQSPMVRESVVRKAIKRKFRELS